MDASVSGWGAVLEDFIVQGRWSWSELRLPIKNLELRAVHLALDFWSVKFQE